ncbi:MAG: four helix bundle protein [Rariglobus sp.]|nr:four helix bundle protein [Rariglobus sp.]
MGNGFKNLKVWQESKRLAVDVYLLTEASGLAKDFGLRDQICRAAVSVPSNIAEGDERDTDKDSVRFFYMAKGSLAELRTQLEIASEIGLITQVQFATLETDCLRIGKMLGALIKVRHPIAPRL